MANKSACDVTKTTVNEIKNESKNATTQLFLDATFHEIWYEMSIINLKILLNETCSILIAISL